MAIYSGYPANGSKDYDTYGSTNTILSAQTDASEFVISTIIADLDTSSLPAGAIITAATIDWYILNDCRSVPVAASAWDGASWVSIRTSANGTAGNRYMTTAITSSNQLACINAHNSGTETRIGFSVPNGISKLMQVRAYEHAAGQTGAIRIGVRYNEPVASSFRRRPFIIT